MGVFMSNFDETLKELLEDRNLSKSELSTIIGIPVSTIYNLKRFNPTVENAILIADYFSSSLDYFEKKTNELNYHYNKAYKINFYNNLRNIMKEQSIKKVKLCDDLGISHSSIERWAKGILPTYANLILVAEYLDISIDKLLGRF